MNTKPSELKKFAINERGELGFIMETQVIGKTKIYLGIPVGNFPSWISLKPVIVKDAPAINAVLEISLHLRPESDKSTRIEDKTNSGSVLSGTFNLNSGLLTTEDVNDMSAGAGSVFHTHPNMTMKDLFGHLFSGQGLPPGSNNPTLPKASDFNLEEKEDDENDDVA
jgi:hypothetical protein